MAFHFNSGNPLQQIMDNSCALPQGSLMFLVSRLFQIFKCLLMFFIVIVCFKLSNTGLFKKPVFVSYLLWVSRFFPVVSSITWKFWVFLNHQLCSIWPSALIFLQIISVFLKLILSCNRLSKHFKAEWYAEKIPYNTSLSIVFP